MPPLPRARSLLFPLLLAVLAMPAPEAAYAADPIFPKASRVGLAPPEGFVVSASFPGFQHNDKQATIMVAELPGYAFDNIEKEVTGQLEKNPGSAVRQELELKDSGRGFLLKGAQTTPQGPLLKWTMVATARDVTAVVTALIPEAVKEVASDEAIRAAFQTLTIRASVPLEEQLSVLPFSMRELAGFRIVRVQPGAAALLTDGPKDAIETAEQPLLVISIGPAAEQPPPEQRDSLARRMMGDMPGLKEMRVVRSEPLRIANQQGHELLLEAKDVKTGADISAVQWLRFGSGTLMRIIGISRKDTWDATYPRFRQVRDGLGRK